MSFLRGMKPLSCTLTPFVVRNTDDSADHVRCSQILVPHAICYKRPVREVAIRERQFLN